jgi:16S rRNA (guanine966-N2)-methyltransferase
MKRGTRELRIIGGRFRGRRLRFPAYGPIRPTPDRVRETLFNWLQPRITGARCLDLFCGSGALGLEALSRGAAAAVFVDESQEVIAGLRATVAQFGAEGAEFRAMDARRYLREPCQGPPFDVVFLDPPFASTVLAPVAAALVANGYLAPDAFVYLEASRRAPLPPLPEALRAHREGAAGEVGYHLFRFEPLDPA